MDLTNRVAQLEDEIKVLKNEVLAVLLDVKENMLNRENPFSQPAAQNADRPVININQSLPAYESAPKPSVVDSALPAEQADRPKSEAAAQGNGNGHNHDDARHEENTTQSNGNAHSHVNAGGYSGNGYSGDFRPQQTAEEEKQGTLKSLNNGNAHSTPIIGHPIQHIAEQEFSLPLPTAWKSSEAAAARVNETSSSIDLDTLLGLMEWVETTAALLGPENTMTILDITEMMGNMPERLKLTLAKLVPHNGEIAPREQASSRAYLNCLKELAKLLGQTNVGDFVAVHVVTHGLSAMTGGEKYG